MALAFTDAQREQIRARLFESAQRHALLGGVRKTSLDALTADAGISKSSFYKFYESKEQLFLQVAWRWEEDILQSAALALEQSAGKSAKERAAAFVYRAFERTHELGVMRFLLEDLPALSAYIPEGEARTHCMDSASGIFAALRQAQIPFCASEETVLSVIQLLYLSILHLHAVGEGYLRALQTLVQGACDQLVA